MEETEQIDAKKKARGRPTGRGIQVNVMFTTLDIEELDTWIASHSRMSRVDAIRLILRERLHRDQNGEAVR